MLSGFVANPHSPSSPCGFVLRLLLVFLSLLSSFLPSLSLVFLLSSILGTLPQLAVMAAAGAKNIRKSLEHTTGGKPHFQRCVLISLGSALVFIALAIGLGLGLGLDRRHGGTSQSSSSPSHTPSSPATEPNSFPLGSEPWRLPPSEYILEMQNWDLDAHPRTRNYNFTLSEIDAFPDGRYQAEEAEERIPGADSLIFRCAAKSFGD